ncbi:divergent polysaccharide deacetylase family protein [Methylobacterium sp. A54F]
MSETPDTDILTQPLGIAKPRAPGLVGRLAPIRAAAASPRAVAIGLGGATLLGLALLLVLGDPRGGEPRAAVTIALREAEPAPPRPRAEPPREPEPVPAAAPAQRSAEEVESASGVVVVRPGGTSAPSEAVVIRVPSPEPAALAPAPDPRLADRGRHGTLPKMGEGRLRALDVYARPDDGAGQGPRIAILLTGVGIGQTATASAITKLPPAVSLAFAPYGEVERNTARARAAGHEILLQAPMEPFDYPDSDPGPQTLLTSLRTPENADRLSWAMSRFPGYVGVVNFMGAKLMGDAAFEPILREIATRGLGFVDDGTAARPIPAALAGKTRVPLARAEIVLDAVPRAEAIDKELARLEAQARSRGLVLASASALPVTIERIARWARDLDARGIRLVPVSVLLRAQPGTRVTRAE